MPQQVAGEPGQPAEPADCRTRLDGIGLGSLLATGELDIHTVTARATERAGADSAFITVTGRRAAQEAESAQLRRAHSLPNSQLDGVPIAVKDLFDVAQTVTTAGSPVLARRPPARHDAWVVHQLSRAGAVLVGKTNLSECAFSGLGINPYYGTPLNPDSHNRQLIPGGSSSGSAVAVASGTVPIALGTDTSGSVRVPAAFCGVIGYKASERRYSRDGMLPLSTTLDSIGILATSMRDIIVTDELLLARTQVSPSTTAHIRLLAPRGELLDDCDPQVRERFERTMERLAEHGVQIERRRIVALEDAQDLMDQNTTIVGAEAYRRYKDLLQSSHRERVDPGLIRRLTHAAQHHHSAAPVYLAMNPLRRRLREEIGESLLVCPTVRHTAPEVQPLLENDELYDETNRRTLRTTMLLSYLGMPGISVPLGSPQTGHMGLLISAPPNDDARLLTITNDLFRLLKVSSSGPN